MFSLMFTEFHSPIKEPPQNGIPFFDNIAIQGEDPLDTTLPWAILGWIDGRCIRGSPHTGKLYRNSHSTLYITSNILRLKNEHTRFKWLNSQTYSRGPFRQGSHASLLHWEKDKGLTWEVKRPRSCSFFSPNRANFCLRAMVRDILLMLLAIKVEDTLCAGRAQHTSVSRCDRSAKIMLINVKCFMPQMWNETERCSLSGNNKCTSAIISAEMFANSAVSFNVRLNT